MGTTQSFYELLCAVNKEVFANMATLDLSALGSAQKRCWEVGRLATVSDRKRVGRMFRAKFNIYGKAEHRDWRHKMPAWV